MTNYQDCLKILGGFQERHGTIYDEKGRKRGTYDETTMEIRLYTRIYLVKVIRCENGWREPVYQVWDRLENKKIHGDDSELLYCEKYLERYYPDYQDPLKYWD